MSEFFYLFAAVLFFCAVYPYFVYPLILCFSNIVLRRKYEAVLTDGDRYPSMSIVFCAYNEERSIAAKLSNVVKVMDAYKGACDANVYLDACSDNSLSLAEQHPAVIDGRINLIIGMVRAGKSVGMNAAVSQGDGEVIVFTDANVILDEECLSVAARRFRDTSIGCLCGNLIYVNPHDSATSQVGSLYWRFEEWLKRAESRGGSTVGADGSLFALKRTLFRPVPADIIDDMYSSMGAMIQGFRIVSFDDFIAKEIHVVRSSDEFHRKVRIACRAVNCLRYLKGQIKHVGAGNIFKIVSHKVMRWLTIFFLMLSGSALVCGILIEGNFELIGFLSVLVGIFIIAVMAKVKLMRSVMEIFLSFIAAGVGLIYSLCGKKYQTWSIAASSRINL